VKITIVPLAPSLGRENPAYLLQKLKIFFSFLWPTESHHQDRFPRAFPQLVVDRVVEEFLFLFLYLTSMNIVQLFFKRLYVAFGSLCLVVLYPATPGSGVHSFFFLPLPPVMLPLNLTRIQSQPPAPFSRSDNSGTFFP